MNELLRRVLFLPPQASSMARELDTFHYVVIGVSAVGAAGVTLVTALFLLRDQGSRAPLPARPYTIRAEIASIVLLLGLFCTSWLIGFRQYVRLRTPPAGALDVYVVARQWMWGFAYPDGTASNGDLYVPVGRPVKLSMTSRDVIHSFYVPAFRVKQDVLPGRTTELWFEATRPGTYDILCTEYCGARHSYMRGRVIVLDGESFETWRRRQATPAEDLVALGRRVASERGCLRCHTLDGTPYLGPSFAGLYGGEVLLADGERVRVDAAYLTRSMMDPAGQVHRGFDPVMPSYLGVLDAGEAAALVELIRSLADGGDVVPEAPPPAPIPGPIEPERAWP